MRAGARLRQRRYRASAPVIDDLSAWCADHGVPVVTLSPQLQVRRRLPRVLVPPPHPSFEHQLHREVSRRFLVGLPNAQLSGANGLVITSTGEFVVESVYARHHLDEDPGFQRVTASRVVRQSGDYFSLIGKFSGNGNYYHWVHDGLLRLHDVAEHLPPEVKYVIPADLAEFGRELLRLLGLRDDQLVLYPDDEVWELERLWFASLPPAAGEVPASVGWFRELVFASTGAPRPVAGRRLYVSRRNAAHCRVVNEGELQAVLEQHGVEVVSTDRMTVTEQIRAFGEAELIVGPHGAGLTNLLFAGDACQIVEITEPVWATEGHAYVFWALAETIGQTFSYVVGESVPQRNNPRPNLRLAPDLLDRALSQLAS